MAVPQPGGRRGVRRKLTDPSGNTYLVQAARSGFVEWSRGGYQGLPGFVVHTSVTWLVNRLVFAGGWTVVVWKGDQIAPKRNTVWKRRYRSQAEAVAALENVAATIARSGQPPMLTDGAGGE
jgi:hypothetical protein